MVIFYQLGTNFGTLSAVRLVEILRGYSHIIAVIQTTSRLNNDPQFGRGREAGGKKS